jgi:hypothetical protein
MSRSRNWRLWVGFVIALLAPFAYFSLFETVRGAFWISIALFLMAFVLLIAGLRRAFAQPQSFSGKIAGPILSVLALLIVGAFGWGSFMMRQAYSEARNAPRVGDKAPEFALIDAGGRKVTMNQLFSTPLVGSGRVPRGVVLVFYRGYW